MKIKKLPIYLMVLVLLGTIALSVLIFIMPKYTQQPSAPSMPTMGFMMYFMLSRMNTKWYFTSMVDMCQSWMGNMMNMMMGMNHSSLVTSLNIVTTILLILGTGALLFTLLILFVLWFPRR